jgi:hypothetical protein
MAELLTMLGNALLGVLLFALACAMAYLTEQAGRHDRGGRGKWNS